MGRERLDALRDRLAAVQESDDLEALTGVIDGLRELTGQLPRTDEVRLVALANLGEALRQRYVAGGALDDLATAIDAQREAGELFPATDRRRPIVLRSLSVLLQTRAERIGGAGAPDDLEEATRTAYEAVAASDPDDPMWAWRVHALAAAQRLRHEATGTESYLTEALGNARRALAAAPGTEVMASHLGVVLVARYDRTGDPALLDEAITLARAATLDDPHHGPMTWNNLSTLLEARHSRSGDSTDRADAVAAARHAVAATDPANIDHGRYQSTLAEILCSRGTPDDLAEAEPAARAAVAAGGPRHAARRALLARILHARATHTSDESAEASEVATAAAAETLDSSRPDGHVLLATAEVLAPTEAAGLYARHALAHLPPDDPGRASAHVLLGHLAGAAEPSAAEHFRAAAEQVGAPPRVRCQAAERWARALLEAGDTEGAATAYRLAVELLPQAAMPGLGRADRERHLEHHPTLAVDAAATALELGDAEIALRMLEGGRLVLHTSRLDLAGDLTALRAEDPETADRLSALAGALDRARTTG